MADPVYEIVDLIASSQAWFGVPDFAAAGAFYGLTSPMTVAQADAVITAWLNNTDAFDRNYELRANRGQPNGYPTLDGSGLIPANYLPASQGALTVALDPASGDAGGVMDAAAFNAATAKASILSAGSNMVAYVKAPPGQIYQVKPALSRNVQYPSGSAPAARNVCVPIPNGVGIDMNGSTVRLVGGTQALIFSSDVLDASTRNHDIALVNATIDVNGIAYTTYTACHFAYIDRMVEANVKIINGTSQGMWHWDVTKGSFSNLDCDSFQGQPWVFGDPQTGGFGTNLVYDSDFRQLKGSNVTLFNTGSQPGNPYYVVLKNCTIDTIRVGNVSAGIKIGQPTDGLTIGQVIIDTCGEATALNSGLKLQGNQAVGGLVNFTGDTSNGTSTILNASSLTGLVNGTPLTGPNLQANTHIVSSTGSTVTISKPANGTASGSAFQQTEMRYVSNVKVGQVFARNCVNLGLYLFWTKDCTVGSYTGYNNVLLHTANADVYMDGGINDRVLDIVSINSGGGGIRITTGTSAYPIGYRMPNVLVVNPGQNPSSAIKNAVRIEGATSQGTMGDVVALDNQASHTMDIGVNILNAGAAGSIASLSVTGNTGSATVNSSGGTFTLPAASAAPVPVDVQVFTANGTWTKPTAGQVTLDLQLLAAAAGGGSGARGPAGTARVAGGGGGGGGYTERHLPLASVTSTVSVTAGAAGTGGAAQTVDNLPGNPGIAGGNLQFGAYARANGGSGGAAGGLAGAGGAGGAGGTGQFPGLAGGSASAAGAAGANGATGATGAGGAAGGGISSGNSDNAGGQGSPTTGGGGVAGTAGTAGGGAGGVGGAAATNSTGPGGGGGGGGANSTGAAGAGGNGGDKGAGGGGGGASANGNNSGKGGDGSGPILIAISRG